MHRRGTMKTLPPNERPQVAMQPPPPNPLEAFLIDVAPVGSRFFLPLRAETRVSSRSCNDHLEAKKRNEEILQLPPESSGGEIKLCTRGKTIILDYSDESFASVGAGECLMRDCFRYCFCSYDTHCLPSALLLLSIFFREDILVVRGMTLYRASVPMEPKRKYPSSAEYEKKNKKVRGFELGYSTMRVFYQH